jgi:diguanylate cyclase (GGDEF)-like protein
VRANDTVARMGGDEFAIVLADAGEEEVRVAAERVKRSFETPFSVGDAPIRVNASVGKAIWPTDGVTVDALVKHADGEMYRHKGQTARYGALASAR